MKKLNLTVLLLSATFVFSTFICRSQSQPYDFNSYEKNLAKYWLYRERLKQYFITEIGPWPSSSLPASERLTDGTMKWGDGTIYLSQYISVLAMEINLLLQAGYTYDDMRQSIEELYNGLIPN